MERREFEQLLARGSLPSVLLFEGEEDYLKQRAWKALRKAVLPEGLEELNETILDAPETDALIAAGETLPFLADRRLVLVRDHPALVGRADADERLLSWLKQAPASTLLVFYCAKKPDGRKKLYSVIKKMNGIVSFSPLRDRELTSFVTESFKKLGKECDERTADYLIFTVGSDTSLLLGEIAKIASHDPSVSAVQPDEVTALATPSIECTVFQMVDAVVTGQKARAFTLLRNQLRSGTERVFILAMLLRQFRLLQHVKIMQYEKKGLAAIRSALGVPAFAADQYVRQASLYSGGQVKQAVKICFETETAIKTGALNAEGAVEAVLLRILTLRD